jgi:hypothetical protein
LWVARVETNHCHPDGMVWTAGKNRCRRVAYWAVRPKVG